MKNVYIAIAVLALIIGLGQLSNASDYTPEQAISGNSPNMTWDCYPYGDNKIGFFQSKEAYKNALNSSTYKMDK